MRKTASADAPPIRAVHELRTETACGPKFLCSKGLPPNLNAVQARSDGQHLQEADVPLIIPNGDCPAWRNPGWRTGSTLYAHRTLFHPSKSCGSLECSRRGVFELLIHMEADPGTQSYRPFEFSPYARSTREKEVLRQIVGFECRHDSGTYIFVPVATDVEASCQIAHLAAADAKLIQSGLWLIYPSVETLRVEPRWSNAVMVADCAHEPLTRIEITRLRWLLAARSGASVADCMRQLGHLADPWSCVLKAVSAGLLWIDFDLPIEPGSAVRLRPGAGA